MRNTGTIRVVGDIHGGVGLLRDCAKNFEGGMLFQVGDLGYGFDKDTDDRLDTFAEERPDFRFIRGNHDSPEKCRTRKGYVESGPYIDGIFCVGGAFSVDYHQRVEGVTWWRDEEHSIGEFDELIRQYRNYKPDVMITHDAPQAIALEINPRIATGESSRTRQALQAMFYSTPYRPPVWLFGHHHKNYVAQFDGTVFICVATGCYVDVDYPNAGGER